MATSYLTPNMSLVIPVPTAQLGPNWAYDVNASLTILDAHNHAPGAGVQIPTSGININADLSFNNAYNVIGLRSARFFDQPSALVSPSDLGCIYEAGGDFYYNNSSGVAVQITSGNSVAVSGAIGFSGLPSGTASASYISGSGSFKFEQSTSVAANLDVATIAIRYPGSYPILAGNYIALQAPSSLASAYSITLPSIPAQNNVMTLNNSGIMSSVTFDAVGQTMTVVGANAIAATMDATGANTIATTMNSTGANAIATTMGATGANIIAANRTRTTGSTVGIGGIAISASSGFVSIGSTTPVPITNLSVTITTSGRPVYLCLTPDGSQPGAGQAVGCFTNTSNTGNSYPGFARNGVQINTGFSNGQTLSQQVGAYNFIDLGVVGAPGTYTYTATGYIFGSTALFVNFCKLVAYEL